MSFVELFVLLCSINIGSVKPSCLFSCRDSEVGNVEEFVLAYNHCLNPKRIYLPFIVIIVKHSPDFKLILVYHKDLLDTHLCQEDIQQFLSAFGSGFVTTRQALYHLQEHMCKECFPHEIGVFLGYPLDDVVSFIQNNGKIIRKSDTGRFITISPVREKQRHAFCRAWNVLWKNCRKAFLWNS